MLIKQYFNKLSYAKKWRIVVIIILFLLSIVDWIIHPPFFKDQNITIVNIETIQSRKDSTNPKYFKRFYYTYNINNGKSIEGHFDLDDFPMPELHQTLVRNVRTPLSEGGELKILSGVFFTFFIVVILFTIHYILFIFLKFVGIKDITQTNVSGLLIILFILVSVIYTIL